MAYRCPGMWMRACVCACSLKPMSSRIQCKYFIQDGTAIVMRSIHCATDTYHTFNCERAVNTSTQKKIQCRSIYCWSFEFYSADLGAKEFTIWKSDLLIYCYWFVCEGSHDKRKDISTKLLTHANIQSEWAAGTILFYAQSLTKEASTNKMKQVFCVFFLKLTMSFYPICSYKTSFTFLQVLQTETQKQISSRIAFFVIYRHICIL